MKNKVRIFSAEEKTKIVLELLKEPQFDIRINNSYIELRLLMSELMMVLCI